MLSQFHPTGTIVPPPLGSQAKDDQIEVGGPLTLDPKDHEFPITIQVMVAQTPEATPGQTDEERFKHANARIARDAVVIKNKDDIVVGDQGPEWKKTLTAPAGLFKDGEARGIAVAVVPNPDEFAYETLTWCGHIKLDVRESTASAVDGEARIGVDLA